MTTTSLSGSWHNIKNAAQERAKRWAFGVHHSIDGTGPPHLKNGDVQRPLLSHSNSAVTQPLNNGLETAVSQDQLSTSQASIRLYWTSPETDL
jgi:hypothetical protein